MRLVPRPRHYDLQVGERLIPLSPAQSALVSRLIGAGGFVPMRALIDVLYGDDPEGGPLTADLCVRVNVTRIRRKLRGTGVRLHGLQWHGYRLEDTTH
jgi:DNA-binding response OmpR family regulator